MLAQGGGNGLGGPRRVLWILDALQAGGAEQLALRFAAAAPPGWQIELVALRAPGGTAGLGELWGPELGPVAAAAHQLRMRRLTDLGRGLELVRYVRQRRPALVHTHLRYATIWGGAAARLLGIPHVATVHLIPSPEPTRRQAWAARLERGARRRAARVIYVSQAQRAAWGEAVRRERAVIIGNGVSGRERAPEASRTAARRARGLEAGACVLTTVAVVRARKGWRTWLQAVELIAAARPEARFLWVGGGPEFDRFQQAAAASRFAHRVRLLGTRTDVAAWLELSDVFLFPSEEEAQPTAVMEAMAAGLPVIASALPSIAEVLGGTGRLVPPADVGVWAQAALEWSEPGAQAVRQQWGERARQRALRCYGEQAWRERVLGLYEEVLNGGHAARAQDSDGRVLRPRRTAAL